MGNLVLTRKAGQPIRIGDDVVLTVREVQATRVHLQVSGREATWVKVQEAVRIPVGDTFCALTLASTQHGHTAKLLFDADRSIKIVRSELLP